MLALPRACAAQPLDLRVNYVMNQDRPAPLTVTFTAQATAGNRIAWDFGDGSGGQGASVTHTSSRPGTSTFQTRMLDSRGRPLRTASARTEVRSRSPERAQLAVLLGRKEVRWQRG
ncbi:MAG: PKD domain-containing protein [Deinococcota bacterium]